MAKKIKVRDENELSTAITMLSAVDAKLKKLQETEQEEVLKIQNKRAKDIGELKESAEQLRTAITDFCTDNRAKVFGDSKTKQFKNGEVTFGPISTAIELLDDWTEEKVVQRLAKKKLVDAINYPPAKVNKTGVKNLLKSGVLKVAHLAKLGLRQVEREGFTITLFR